MHKSLSPSQVPLQRIVTGRATASLEEIYSQCVDIDPDFRLFFYDTAFSSFEEIGIRSTNAGRRWSDSRLQEIDARMIPIFRGNQIVGYYSYGSIDSRSIAQIETYCSLVPFIYNRRVANRVLRNLHEPVEFQESKEFFVGLCSVAHQCSGMELGALRLLDKGRLKCNFAWNMHGAVEYYELARRDCLPNDNHFFEDALSSGEIQICNDIQSELPEFSKMVGQNGVRTFCAVPVHVGAATTGVFSIAQKELYEFSWAEKQGFTTIANAIGVSISNFKNYHSAMEEARDREKDSALLTAVGVVQGVRHHLKAQARALTSNVDRLSRVKKIDSRYVEITELLGDIALEIKDSLERMKLLMDVEKKLEEIDIKELFREVYIVHQHKFEEDGIKVSGNLFDIKKKEKTNFKLLTIPSVMRYTLHNMFLNVVDALSGVSRNRRRFHGVIREDGDDMIIELRDSGRGLEIEAIKSSMMQHFGGDLSEYEYYVERNGKGSERRAIYSWIFREGFTTKSEGSGHGLSLSRRHMAFVAGSIEAFDPIDVDWKIGFRITFSKSILAIFKSNQRGKLIVDESAPYYRKYEAEILSAYAKFEDLVHLESRNSSLKQMK